MVTDCMVPLDFLRSKKKISSNQLISFVRAHTPACILLQFKKKSDCDTLDDISVALEYYVNVSVRTGKPMGYLAGNRSLLKSTFHSEGWFIAIRDSLIKVLHSISLSDFEKVCNGLKPLKEIVDFYNSMDFPSDADFGYAPIESLSAYLSAVSSVNIESMDDFEEEIAEEGQRVWNLARCLEEVFNTAPSSGSHLMSPPFPLSPLMSAVNVDPKIPSGVSFFRKAPNFPEWEDGPGQFFLFNVVLGLCGVVVWTTQ